MPVDESSGVSSVYLLYIDFVGYFVHLVLIIRDIPSREG